MKIALFSRDFFPSAGGIQTVVLELARGLAEWRNPAADSDGIEVTVITGTGGSRESDCRFPFSVIRRPNLSRIVRLIRCANIIHLAGPSIIPLSTGLLLGKPVIIEHHGFQAVCPNGQLFYEPGESTCPGHYMARNYRECLDCNKKTVGWLGSFRLLLLTPVRRWLCNHASGNIAPTHWLASVLKLKRQKVVPHGVSDVPPDLEPRGNDSRAFTFAYQGRLVSTKGIRVLLRAFKQLCEEGRAPRLLIIGTGPGESTLRAEAIPFEDRVKFLGQVPTDKLHMVLAEAGCVVMPSTAGEVFGLVAAESMMRGKVLITSDLGSLREVVGEAGLVFPAGNATALAECMRMAMDESNRATHLARAARVRAERVFRRERMIAEHISVYREALGRYERKRNKIKAS